MMRGMEDLVERLEQLDSLLADATESALSSGMLGSLSNDRLLEAIAAASRISRRAEALLIESTSQVEDRSDIGVPREARLTTMLGCASTTEVIQRATGLSSRSAKNLRAAGRAIVQRVALSSGETLPAEFPAMRAALISGHVGVDGLLAVTGPLAHLVGTAGRAAHAAADEELARSTRGG